jgi:molybdopterin/thiamine biosynthesis adenylyltransferase
MGRWESERDSGGREHTENIVAQTFDRQVRVFGASAQRQLQALRVAIVGLGGTGSLVAQQLAHLGVGRFLLIDHDTIDESNLNRVVGAEALDVARTSKVDVAARMIMRISPSARVEAVKGNAVLQGLAAKIVECDTVFSCADSHGSRFVLNQLAYQFFIPVFDVGVAIAVGEGSISHVFGRTQMLVPGLPCLTCFRTLDPEEIRRDLMSDVERRKDSYVMGDVEPQPAVVSINSTVSSLAITMFLSAFAGVPVATRHQIYDAMRGMVRPIVGNTVRDCVTCSTEGAFGRGDSWPLPGLRE